MAKSRMLQVLVTDEEYAAIYKRMMEDCLANNKKPSISGYIHEYIKPLMNGHNPIDNKQDAEPIEQQDSEPVAKQEDKHSKQKVSIVMDNGETLDF